MNRWHAANFRVFNRPDVVAFYGSLSYITSSEQLLFSKYVKPGSAILDVGVGGGRTTAFLSRSASRYAGVDYSEEMVRICQQRYPQFEFIVSDASDLSVFQDGSFDAVVMAFNAVDYVLPKDSRWAFLRESRRVLRTGGVLIFSSHNPRFIGVSPSWNQERLRTVARSIVSEGSAFYQPLLFALTTMKASRSCLRAARQSTARAFPRVFRRAFWCGEGTLLLSGHGGLLTHSWVPKRVIAELAGFGFEILEHMVDSPPRAKSLFLAESYYYVFERSAETTV